MSYAVGLLGHRFPGPANVNVLYAVKVLRRNGKPLGATMFANMHAGRGTSLRSAALSAKPRPGTRTEGNQGFPP
jgi:hypothetical protein